MENNLITKKDLLDTTGISYGSLYRWKRKNLIPDEWFIHRATFTGHETFFPKDKVVERINKILELKETMSLDDVAAIFNPPKREVEITPEDIVKLGITTEAVINLYLSKYGNNEVYDFDSLFPLYVFSQVISLGYVSRNEAFLSTQLVKDAGTDLQEFRLVFLRKLGVFFSLLIPENNLAFYDSETALVGEISIHKLRSQLIQILASADIGFEAGKKDMDKDE